MKINYLETNKEREEATAAIWAIANKFQRYMLLEEFRNDNNLKTKIEGLLLR